MQYDLSHQAGVMTAVNGFVDWVLNLELNQSSFITHLCSLIPAFQIFDQNGIEYSASIQAFKDMTQAIEALRGALCLEDYLIRLSSVEILKLMRRLKDHRSQILDEIRLFRQQESDNQTSFLTYVQQMIQDHYQVLMVRVDLVYLKDYMSNVTVHDFYLHIQSLCRYLKDKNGCFKHLLGYGLALEQGYKKGYHAHLMLVYNGSERCQDRYLGDLVILKWQAITHGWGYGRNGNTKENKDQFANKGLLGIGRIHRKHPKELQNALNVARYLTHPEKYLQRLLVKPIGKRTFFKGVYRVHGRNYQLVSG
ncbi:MULTISPECIES: inovirus-type Gp2 protein [Acinetobacter]|uniref:inovirus-type Gp2 protein n=1 Tax=Acinetobacter TaxID=469 RepID=UPI0005B499E9|nr:MULTISPECIES: inovirus-type Gp2 protein [Acinetobacter]MBC69131.1 inovirus Gp2 family protein [Acinetobacter sp.]MBT48696.1 inovirus Gp2 family protein [Acinetobacter sp.]MDU2407663.1 inovirus-type Gp2 protein [Acinetobacter junii]HJP46951.1 inovirus-type Gp2 protein [Acinetobacter venetianus]|tara:strand:+ start:541 stop:1464 length:924 start_codon:yes stop_codon:yes gene_type:complete